MNFNSKYLPEDLLSLLGKYSDSLSIRCEPDYYGAAWLIAQELGRSYIPRSFSKWSHGAFYYVPKKLKWQLEKETKNVLVANLDIKLFLESSGIKNVYAVGLPILYTKEYKIERRSNSLLLMPIHGLSYVNVMPNYEELIPHAKAAIKDGMFVCFCIYQDVALRNPAIIEELDREKIPWFFGASVSDCYSLQRMRNIFSYFEFVGSDGYGSHWWYSQLYGAKFYCIGRFNELSADNFKHDQYYIEHPDALREALHFSSRSVLLEKFPQYFGGRNLADCSLEIARSVCGVDYKVSTENISKYLGWGVYDQTVGYANHLLRRALRKTKKLFL